MRILLALLLLLPCCVAVCQEEEPPHALCEMALEEYEDQGDVCHFFRGTVLAWAKLASEQYKVDLEDTDQSLLTFGEAKEVVDYAEFAALEYASGNTARGEAHTWMHHSDLKIRDGMALCAAGDHEGAAGKYSWATSDLFTAWSLLMDAASYYDSAAAYYSDAMTYIWWAGESNECLVCMEKDPICICDPDNQPDPEEPDPEEPDPEEPDPEEEEPEEPEE